MDKDKLNIGNKKLVQDHFGEYLQWKTFEGKK